MVRNLTTLLRATFLLLTIGVAYTSFSQDFNKDHKLTFVNHSTPKSPESASFEKYGTIPVSEKTGIPDISIPLHTIGTNTLAVPVSLSYHASGIKVNQEATWVGLGWDIMTGGRITLEIKGGYDVYTKQYITLNGAKKTLEFLLAAYGDGVSNNMVVNTEDPCVWNAQNTYDYFHNGGPLPCSYPIPVNIDSLYDSDVSSFFFDLENFIKYGATDPDLYHVNFLGNSFTFYYDLLTDSIKLKEEQNKFRIEEFSSPNRHFIITDNNGISYSFMEQEESEYDPPIGLYSNITTSWLLTKIQNLNGDSILLNYTNYGAVFPAPAISESESFVTLNGGTNPNVPEGYNSTTNKGGGTQHQKVYQFPKYLTQISTKSTELNFEMSVRKDLTGDGARKLDKILVKSKLSNEVFKEIKFNYSHFQAFSGNYYFDTSLACFRIGTAGPDNNAKNHLTLRLKLDSISVFGVDSNIAATHKFQYNVIQLPNKVSLAQDHWGYYNGSNYVGSPTSISFTPSVAALITEGVYSSGFTTNSNIPGRMSRKADVDFAKAGSLEAIEFPTGGKTNFEFDLHKFYMGSPTAIYGAGLRIRKITANDTHGGTPIITEYDYGDNGFYQGAINYIQVKSKAARTADGSGNVGGRGIVGEYTLFSNGCLNQSGPQVMYSSVTQKFTNNELGKIVKTFDVYSPHTPHIVEDAGYKRVLEPYYLTPVPYLYSYGNLVSEKYYNSSNILLREKEYLYNPNLTSKLYNVRADDMFFIHPMEGLMINSRDLAFYFEPVIYRNTVLDSTREVIYANETSLVTTEKYTYNSHFQPELLSTNKSNGEQIIAYTKTPLSFTDVPQGEPQLMGNASAVSYMRYHNILDVPVERIIMKRSPTGDTSVLRGAYNIYDLFGNITETYLTENAATVPIGQFSKSGYSGSPVFDILKDHQYKLDKTVTYSGKWVDYWLNGIHTGPYVKEITTKGFPVSFVYDTLQDQILAVAEGASQGDIAYTSFDATGSGNWAFTGSGYSDNTAPTGTMAYNLGQSGGAISRTNLNAGKVYSVSYWTKNGNAFSIPGTISGSIKQGPALQGWNYFEQKITGQTTVTISGSGYIDELRLYPSTAQMKTFTYDAFSRMAAESGAGGNIAYYGYDPSNRLSVIRDQERSITKKFSYKYAGQRVNFDGKYYHSNLQAKTWTKNNCSSGVPQQVLYHVPEGKYTSLISQEDADQQAISDLNANGQAYANTNGGCQFYNTFQQVSFTQNNCSPGYAGATVTYSVPALKHVSLISQYDANQMALAELAVISANGQTVANQGTCTVLVTINCTSSSVPEPFTLELYNVNTHAFYYFTIDDYGAIGQVPAGTYNLRINPESYSQPYSYIINGTYYQSGEMSAVFENIPITDSNSPTIYIYL